MTKANILSILSTSWKKMSQAQLFPAKLRGTFVEKWASYWKNLCLDYKEVAVETISNARNRPRKACLTLGALGFLGYSMVTNPDEQSYRDLIVSYSNEMITVGEVVRNPKPYEHLRYVESCFNSGIIRHLSLGVFSLIWLDNYDTSCGIYTAQCSYLKPRFYDFERIIDIGFLNKWWLISKNLKDYDVNPSEFPD